MRFFLCLSVLMLLSLAVQANDAPPGQKHIKNGDVLRGRFTQQHQIQAVSNPMQSTGHFIIAPDRGLIWQIEKPFPTTTIVTPDRAVQDLGGLVMKLPAKNMRHLYTMVGGALEGDWSGLANDFTLTQSGDAHHWQMLLTPREGGKSTLGYASITVTGGAFVDNIAMVKADGSADILAFSEQDLAKEPLLSQETSIFAEANP